MLRFISRCEVILLLIQLSLKAFTIAFLTCSPMATVDLRSQQPFYFSTSNDTISNAGLQPCFYKSHDNRWRQRIQLESLRHGQRLTGVAINGTELLEGKTGPKLFFECGVGRIDSKGRWQMVSGMMRLGSDKSTKMKLSIAKKKCLKYLGKPVELFVTKIRLDHGTLEVSSNSPSYRDNDSTLISASTLKQGEEMIGTILEVRPYGCIVNVGANRKGLLHIKMIARLYGKYIAQVQGIIDAGLEKGAKIRVSVHSNIKKRLLLDFPVDVKESAGISLANPVDIDSSDISTFLNEDITEWVSFATRITEYNVEGNELDESDGNITDEEEDEDRIIEDSFGLGSY